MKKEPEDAALSEKDQEMIAVGASVAAGCLPCTKFHLRAAAALGAGEAETHQAVRDAVRVRRTATEIMAKAGGLSPAETGEKAPGSDEAGSLIREFVSIGAAYAVSCSTSLEKHMASARLLGATDEQMLAAIKIACAIKDVAVEKAKAAAGEVLGVNEERAASCDCIENETASSAGASNRPLDEQEKEGAADCCCRTGNK